MKWFKHRPKNAGKEKKPRRFRAWSHTAGAKCAMVIALGSVILCGILCLVSAPERYNLQVGAVSRQTINATKDVVDEIATEEARKAAASAVEPTYHLSEGVADGVLSDLDTIFDELRSVQQYGLTLRTDEDTDESFRQRTFTDEEISYALDNGMVTSFPLQRYQATTLMRTTTEEFDVMVTTVKTAVTNSLNTGIREGKISDAIATIQQIVGYRVDISLVQNILPTVLRKSLVPNMVVDKEATERARQSAMDAVEPVIYRQGQNIIREGDVVTRNQYEMLKSLGLLQNNQLDWMVYGGAFLLTAAAVAVLVMLLRLLSPETLHDLRRTSVIMVVMVVNMGVCALVVRLGNVYVAPLALCAMLLTTLLGADIGLCGTTAMALMLSGLAAGDTTTQLVEMIYMLLMGLVGGIVSVRFLNGRPQRARVLLCSALTGAVNAALVMTIGLMNTLNLSTIWLNVAWASLGGIVSGVITIGLQPVFEAVFNLATPSKLLELSNPNHPLLRRLLLEASGTYHHSIIVANLAEAAAESIGANPLLARTAAYFHDIGKLKRPQYFKENQMGENPLNQMDPYVSAAIVTSHTRDGLQLAQKYRLPREIQQIIVEHHGDTPVMYFYSKAVGMANGQPVDIADFRYDGPRPTTREAAILMLADTVEAAVRAMPDPTPQSIADKIQQLVRGKIDDGQLNDSPLSLRDIDQICETFVKVLNGVFHERIEYPTTELPARNTFFSAADAQPPAQETANAAAAEEKESGAHAADLGD